MTARRHRHYSDHIISGYLVLALAVQPVHMPRPVEWGVLGGTMAVLAYGLFRQGQHLRGLCEACVARMPLDVERRVQRARPVLRCAHVLSDGFGGWGVMAPLVGVLVATALFSRLGWGVAALVSVEVMLVVALVNHESWRVHRRYQPWCPFCPREGGDGDRSGAPGPSEVQPA